MSSRLTPRALSGAVDDKNPEGDHLAPSFSLSQLSGEGKKKKELLPGTGETVFLSHSLRLLRFLLGIRQLANEDGARA